MVSSEKGKNQKVMNTSEKVNRYIEKHSQWKEELTQVRTILNTTELTEDIKWGAPAYTLNGKILIGLAGFKNHAALWFHQGVFLKDPDNKLLNAQEGKTKALRQWRIEKEDVLDLNIILKYIEEAIANSKAGKEMKMDRSKKLVIPELLSEAFKIDPDLHEAFNSLTPGKKREYADHISSAKRAATKLSRLEKKKPMIQKGVGLHDKYKNC